MTKRRENPQLDRFLTYREAAQYLSVKVGTLYSWVSRGVIPYVRVGPRVVRFPREELVAWLKNRTVQPTSEEGHSEGQSAAAQRSTTTPRGRRSHAEDDREP